MWTDFNKVKLPKVGSNAIVVSLPVRAGPNKGKNFVVNGMRSYVVPSCMYCKIESLAMVKKTMGFGIKFLNIITLIVQLD
jgi:hypothetical protein